MKRLLVLSLAFVLIISALLLVGCSKEPEKEPVAECPHSYEKTVTNPTCTEAGEEKFSCTKCDYYYTTIIEATGHTGGTPVDENRTEATCTVDGKYDSVVYCTVCELEVSSETTVLAALGHTGGLPVEENSTICMDGKYDSVIYCIVCDAEVSRETVTATEKIHDVQNGVCTICGGKKSTPGLKYIQNYDGTYTVTGIGTCTETDIVIGIYNNRDVTSIYYGAFSNCTSLTSIELPDSLTTIGERAFYDCPSLESIVIPEGVTTIGYEAFRYCESLTSIVIPEGVTTIGSFAFYICTSLTIYCEVAEKPDEWSNYWNPSDRPVVWGCQVTGDGFVYETTNNSVSILKYIGLDNNIVIPTVIDGKNVTAIGDGAFRKCTSLTSIVIPEGVTTIGDDAFYKCTSLTSIVIPEGVTAIGSFVFDSCYSLTIYCEATAKPSGWSSIWNPSDCHVVWGYTGE